MTNGEKLKEVFPSIELYEKSHDGIQIDFNSVWWNAEYKEPSSSEKPNKSEIPTSSVDCISRQAVLEIYDEWFTTCNIADRKASPKAKINALPPVTPIRPKGHWIWELDETPSTPISPYELNYAGWVCSCCHKFPDDICEWDNPDEPPTYKFCPNCGADMRGEK